MLILIANMHKKKHVDIRCIWKIRSLACNMTWKQLNVQNAIYASNCVTLILVTNGEPKTWQSVYTHDMKATKCVEDISHKSS